jgi:hypothetical protein
LQQSKQIRAKPIELSALFIIFTKETFKYRQLKSSLFFFLSILKNVASNSSNNSYILFIPRRGVAHIAKEI